MTPTIVFIQGCSLVIVVVYILHVSLELSNGAPHPSIDDGPSNFNVITYGAIGDGKHDDTQAFMKAWRLVCGLSAVTNDIPTLTVPAANTFLLTPATFSGPCNSPTIHLQIQGKLVAPSHRDGWKNCNDNSWLVFQHITNLIVDGSGVIDGQGSSWWKRSLPIHDQHTDDTSCNNPKALTFCHCNGLRLQGTKHINSPRAHLSITGCNNSTISNINIEAPANSPNTDGIDLNSSNQVQIRDSTIATGDDCIAIGTRSSWITVTGVTCGPGHGISIGSLGRKGEHARVEQVHIQNCTFKGSSNGARIKTWQGGSGYARNITYEDISLINVQNPIIIDQFYCCGGGGRQTQVNDCRQYGIEQKPAVAISGVTYRGFKGTSASEVAISLNCSSTVPCTTIFMEKIDITSSSTSQIKIHAVCNNAQGKQVLVSPPVPCLHPLPWVRDHTLATTVAGFIRQ